MDSLCQLVIAVQLLSYVQLFVIPWIAAHQVSLFFTVSQSLIKFMSIESVMLSNQLILCQPLLLLPSIFPASGFFPMSQLFASGSQIASIGISALASVLPMNILSWLPSGLTGLISLLESPKDSQESSPAPQFESINFSVLSHLYDGPVLTSIQDYWKNHSFDNMDLCQ